MSQQPNIVGREAVSPEKFDMEENQTHLMSKVVAVEIKVRAKLVHFRAVSPPTSEPDAGLYGTTTNL
jgi:hypothetical protein